MSERHPLCALDELPEPASRGFSLALPEGNLELVLVRVGGRLRAYRNRCPHTGVNLEWRPDQFLDFSESFIQCATHGALFRPDDGLCVRGPCAGQRLEPLALVVDAGRVYLERSRAEGKRDDS